MPVDLNGIKYGNLLEKDYDKALKLSNRYSFINANLFPMLSKEEQTLLMGFQDVCRKNKKNVDENLDDIYKAIPAFGAEGMVQRLNEWKGVPGSAKHQMLLNFALDPLSPELELGMTASGILAGNSLYHNPDRNDYQEKALTELYAGTKVGSLGMTEMERGSDAVNMLTKINLHDDGSVTYNGTKIYNTNGAVADYISTYGVTDISEPRRTMMFTLFERNDPGIEIERLSIPAAPGVGIAKVNFNNVTVSAERVLAGPGEGYKRLFRGLTPERIAIIGGSIAGLWNALAHGILFTQVRHQFHKPLFKHQAISNVIADLYAKTAAYTSFAFQVADMYDKRVGHKIHKGEKPDPMDEGFVAIMAAQGKYLTAKLAHEAAYEIVQTMGGRGAISEAGSNNIINRLENSSRIQEVIGGHRNIQLMIIQSGLKATTAMALGGADKKGKKNNAKIEQEVTEAMVERAKKLLATEPVPDEAKAQLEGVLAKLAAAAESKNDIELKAYAGALPKVLAGASKAAYKAKKEAQ